MINSRAPGDFDVEKLCIFSDDYKSGRFFDSRRLHHFLMILLVFFDLGYTM
jgi:hypothetical protein